MARRSLAVGALGSLMFLLGAAAIAGCGNGDDDDDAGDAGGSFDASTDATSDATSSNGEDGGADASKGSDAGKGGDATTGGGNDGGDAGSGDSGGTDGGDSGGSTPDSGVDAGPDAGPTAAIHFYGRFDTHDTHTDPNLYVPASGLSPVITATPAAPVFDWSGSGIVADFVGNGLAVTLTNYAYSQNGYDELQVILDGTPTTTTAKTTSTVVTLDNGACASSTPCTRTYTLAAAGSLDDGQHHVEIYKRTEALYGYIQFGGFANASGGSNDWALVPTADPYPRRIEFIGDSITAGYGVNGPNASCSDDGAYNNVYQAFSGDTAHQLGASFVAIAHSGEGVYMDSNGSTSDPIGLEYPRTVQNFGTDSTYDFATKVDAVVINLGTNDFTGYQVHHTGNPGTKFTGPYVDLVTTVRSKYPSAYILLLAGPMVTPYNPYTGADADLKADLDAVVASFAGNGDTRIADLSVGAEPDCQASPDLCGCGDHPSVAEQSTVATAVVGALKTALGW